ncbi:hypothetical protein ABB37_00197 [Leptomonas pyrrhocoris]|uniref:Uncharacterized protein n=1 Tax=Leptomonas pyrrhocoris TaxID=157538 RepID=A0A0N0E007_LEPPY|nr:hypothetical protein ABB37_00197 [Leptomonas pyrrhocoris]KPA85875.1 hypothetical protein ABB37_00197 [Leptomonas pyrrhocoris]|eukprot:XP_015664314.1 hypothetical protein ABB37_00197 [Leptomonas pyrrhocoris]
MFLTYTFAPIWAGLISLLTFLVLRHFDPVDLNQYTEKMHGVPPVACCLAVLIPLVVLVAYDFALKLGPKPSRYSIKM